MMSHVTRAFHHRPYRLFFIGQSVSLIGTWSQSLAISWLAWRMTHSPTWLGVIGFAQQFPILIFGLVGGAIADRHDRLRLLTLSQALCMVNAIAMTILTATGLIQLWHIVVLSIWLGTIYAFEFPLRQAFVMDMVGRNDVMNAVSLNSAMIHGTRMLGPVAAGFIVAWKGEVFCFVINTISFLVLIGALLLIDRRDLRPASHISAPLGKAIREGLLFMHRTPQVALVTLLIAALSLFGFLYDYLLPMLADEVFAGTAVELGWLMGSGGFGALVGAVLLAGRRSHHGLLTLCTKMSIAFSLTLFLFTQVKTLWWGMGLLAVMGFFSTILFAGTNTYLQHQTPDHLRGRIMSLFTTILTGVMPITGLLGGMAAEHIGAATAIAIGAILSLIASIGVHILARHFAKKEPVG